VIEEALLKRKIPYHIENGMTFYEKPEVKALLDYLRLIHDPNSTEGDDALKSALFIPNRYVSRRFISQIEEYAGSNKHLYQVLKTMPVDIPYLRNNIRNFIRLIDSMMEIKDMTEPSEMIMMLRDALNYDKWITDNNEQRPDDDLIANLDQLQMAASKYHDIPSLLNYTDSFREQRQGSDDGVLPNAMGDIEEERRVAFVGISRAKQLLYLSYSIKHLGKAGKVSPFLEDTREAIWQLNENSRLHIQMISTFRKFILKLWKIFRMESMLRKSI
jgi:DNA helicase-2/ATP-dependent DNA helicase PcrA